VRLLRIYIETPLVPKLSLFLSLHSFFHALLILTVEGEYGMKLTLVTASERNAYTVGYTDFQNLMGFTSKKMPDNIL
jgi:hypothetical protein